MLVGCGASERIRALRGLRANRGARPVCAPLPPCNLPVSCPGLTSKHLARRGRHRMESEGHFSTRPISDIPNRHRLVSHQEHAKPVYVEGLLLEPKGCVFKEGHETRVIVCQECLDSLKKGGVEDHLPP